jgi:hypothetical protein
MRQRTGRFPLYLQFQLFALALSLLFGRTAVAQGTGAMAHAGLFRIPVIYDSGGQTASALAVADLNGDGKPDIVVVNFFSATSDGAVGVPLNAGSGSFRPAVSYDAGGGIAISVAIADLNGEASLTSLWRITPPWACCWAMETAPFNLPSAMSVAAPLQAWARERTFHLLSPM